MTKRQWLEKGYLVKEGAKGVLSWNNRNCTWRVYRYSTDEVEYNPEEAKKQMQAINHKAYLRYKENKARKKREWENEEYTSWQWLAYERMIPRDNENPCQRKNGFWYYKRNQVESVSDERYKELKALYIKKFGDWDYIDFDTTTYNGEKWW